MSDDENTAAVWMPALWRQAIAQYGRSILIYGFFFKCRGLLMVPLLAVMLLVHWPPWHRDLPDWLIGGALFVAGLAVRVWCQRYLRYRLRLPRPELATAGPYAFVRNPVYWGNTLLLCGLTFMLGTAWLLPLTIVWSLAVYSLAVRFEEARLRKEFGAAYDDYCRLVPRWVPRFKVGQTGPRASLGSALAVEWQCAVLLLLAGAKELMLHAVIMSA